MRSATSGATRWLIAPDSARDTVEGCTPHFSAMSLMVGRDEAVGLAALPAPVLALCTIGGIPVHLTSIEAAIRHPEVRALRCTCTAGRASKDERPGCRPGAVVLRDA